MLDILCWCAMLRNMELEEMNKKLVMKYMVDGVARKQVITFCTWHNHRNHCIFDMSHCDHRSEGVPEHCHLIGKKVMHVEFGRE